MNDLSSLGALQPASIVTQNKHSHTGSYSWQLLLLPIVKWVFPFQPDLGWGWERARNQTWQSSLTGICKPGIRFGSPPRVCKVILGLTVPQDSFPHWLVKGDVTISLSNSCCYPKPIAGSSLPNNDFNISGIFQKISVKECTWHGFSTWLILWAEWGIWYMVCTSQLII